MLIFLAVWRRWYRCIVLRLSQYHAAGKPTEGTEGARHASLPQLGRGCVMQMKADRGQRLGLIGRAGGMVVPPCRGKPTEARGPATRLCPLRVERLPRHTDESRQRAAAGPHRAGGWSCRPASESEKMTNPQPKNTAKRPVLCEKLNILAKICPIFCILPGQNALNMQFLCSFINPN
jgi:hypothetical protein